MTSIQYLIKCIHSSEEIKVSDWERKIKKVLFSFR